VVAELLLLQVELVILLILAHAQQKVVAKYLAQVMVVLAILVVLEEPYLQVLEQVELLVLIELVVLMLAVVVVLEC
jgi:hypothetical protein